MTAPALERRARVDRRVRRVSLHYPERRTGFDRRTAAASDARVAYLRLLHRYRARSAVVALVLGLVVALSLADLLLTLGALERGATEANPVMARLFDAGPEVAGVVKMGIILAVVAGIWAARRYRRALEASLILLAGFLVLMLYHLVGMLLLAG